MAGLGQSRVSDSVLRVGKGLRIAEVVSASPN